MTRVLRSSIKKSQLKNDIINELSSYKKPKTIKRSTKKKVIAKNKESQQNDIWNINSIISNIFSYTELKDLIKFNTVCKKWSNITNPIIHKTIKLQRRRAFQNKDIDKRLVKSAKTDTEVEMCIINNSKHAQFIKKLKFSENLQPQRAIQLFETFRFIENLTLEKVGMSQDQFISMITHLAQLQELNLKRFRTKRIIKHKFVTKPANLPPSLTKLTLDRIYLHNDPELFVQTINSHTNLIEFRFDYYSTDEFLNPFLKCYPTLKKFEFNCYQNDHDQTLIEVFESNPQLISLKLDLSGINYNFTSDIARHLTNLEEFAFTERDYINTDISQVILKHSQPTKIKKLNLKGDRLTEYSSNFLVNSPDLEKLSLCHIGNYQNFGSTIPIKLHKSVSIKKLNIICDSYDESSLHSILTKCSHLKELEIKLPREWKECIKVIGRICCGLESLTISPSSKLRGQELDTFRRELYEMELLSSNSLYKSTLKHLILNQFNIYESKAEYFKDFPKLKYIEYQRQIKPNGRRSNIEANFDKDLWPSYRLDTKIENYYWDAKLVKLNF